jgi:phosphoglycerate dehydrogenase-like enzyme
VAVRVTCLSPFAAETVKALFPARFEVEVTIVEADASAEAIRDAVRDADLVVGDKTHRHRLDRAALQLMTRCRLIHQPAVGFDTIDHIAAAEFGIPVANSAGFNSDAVADWTVMAILVLVRRAALADRTMRAGGWPLRSFTGRELRALTVGVVGFGNAGRRVAERLHPFGPTLLHSDVAKRTWEGSKQVSVEELLRASNVVTLHTVLDSTTQGLINAESLALMPRGSYLVNASRGPIIVESDVVEALRSGQLAGAALDVFAHEPLADDSPLRAMDNVLLSPHVAGFTSDSEARLLEITSANLVRVLDGQTPFNVVNGVALFPSGTQT